MTWRAEIRISTDDDGGHHLVGYTNGDTSEDALTGANAILALTDGKERYVRHLPTVESEKLFDTGEITHTGRVRYTYFDRTGDSQTVAQPDTVEISGFGAAA